MRIKQEKIEFSQKVQERIERLLPENASTIFYAAMGGSIKDVLMNIPLADKVNIVTMDKGPYLASPNEDSYPEQIREAYFLQYCRRRDSNYIDSWAFDVYADEGIGKKQVILWELEEFGITETNERPVSDNTYALEFKYLGRDICLCFVEEFTSNFRNAPQEVLGILESGIDVVINKGCDGAYDDKEFKSYVLENLNPLAVILADNANDLACDKIVEIEIGPDLEEYIDSGMVFGYPLDAFRGTCALYIGQKRNKK